MERYLNILEAPRQQQEETFDEEKIKFINSKISIWDFFGIPQATYLSYANEEKSRMFKEYYTKLVDKFCGQGKFLFVSSGLSGKFSDVFLNIWSDIFLGSFLENLRASTQIDNSISQAIQNANKIYVSKNIFSDNI